jgi:hypothetical protein
MQVHLNIRKVFEVIVSVLVLVAVHTVAVALDDAGSMRCDQESITSGETEFQVKTACGEPDSILIKGFAKKVWIYNFGPTKFIYYLTFVNGRLERIQVGEHGHYQKDHILD